MDPAIPVEILAILACPESRQSLRYLEKEPLMVLNEKILLGGISTVGGKSIERSIDSALVREDGKRVYRVEEGIPILLINEGINYLP